MSCETYREALIEAGASGTRPPAAISAHLQVCAGCRATLAREQFLFASIDSSLHAAVNADVPPSFLAQVRAQLNHHQVVRRRFWVPAWTAIASAAALALLMVLIHNPKRDPHKQVSKEDVVANNAPSPERPSAPTVYHSEHASSPKRSKPIRPVETRPVVPFEHVSVLVPAGQKEAIDALIATLRQGKVKLDVLLAEKPQQLSQDLRVSPLDISPIEMKPLADVSGESPTEAEKTRL